MFFKKICLWAVLPVGLVSFLLLSAEEALSRPIVRIGIDGQCLSVLKIKDDQEVEVGCDVVDLEHDRYNIQHVFSPQEVAEIQKVLVQR
jgi:cupin superfamily acireductone dioxygenase involved in methionine salvage